MKSFFKKNKNKILSLSVIFLVASFLFFLPNITNASVSDAIATVIGWILTPFIWLFGQLLILFINILIGVAQYNDFINSSAVSYGWTLVRDFSNMFFVLILLIIAFATILRVESYNLKTWLPKLIIMAVLINFSKLICGLFIDFAQVIMLTFVNAIKDVAGANITHMLGISEIMDASYDEDSNASFTTIVASLLLALIFTIVACVVILTMIITLIMRVIMIWIYVVLSPLAYLLGAFPQGQSYSQRWWSDFSKNLIIGPVLAFFIWLAFASLGGGMGESKDVQSMKPAKDEASKPAKDEASKEFAIEGSGAGTMDHMIKFIVSLGMLIGGLMLAQEMGGMAGKVAGKGMAKLQSMGSGAVKGVKRGAGRLAKGVGKRAAETGLRATGKMMGKDSKVGKLAKGWGDDMKESRQKRAVARRENLMTKMGMGSRAGAAGQELTSAIKDKLNDPSGEAKAETKKGQDLVASGNIKVEFGENMIKEGEEKIGMAENLESLQSEYNNKKTEKDDFGNNSAFGLNSEEYKQAEAEEKELEQKLNLAKTDSGLKENATEAEVLNKAAELKDEGQENISSGQKSLEEGRREVSSGEEFIGRGKQIRESKEGGFGDFVIGNTNKAFKKLNKDHNDAKDFVGTLEKGSPDLDRVSGGNFSDVGGNLNSKQMAVFNNLNKNDVAASNLRQSVSSVASKGDEMSDDEVKKINSISEGLSTYEKASGGNLSPEMEKLKQVINSLAKDNSKVENVDQNKAGKYRPGDVGFVRDSVGGDKKEMDPKANGIGSINQFGRGQKDQISYNFEKLKDKGIDIDPSAKGAYFEEGESKDKIKAEIVLDIKDKINEIERKKSSGAELTVGDNNNLENLKNAQKRLEKGDDFSLVNANKKSPKLDAVATQRHENVHQYVSEKRKNSDYTPTKKQQKEEEVLIEKSYAKKAAQGRINDVEVDKQVAEVIVRGQIDKKSFGDISKEIDAIVEKEKVKNLDIPVMAGTGNLPKYYAKDAGSTSGLQKRAYKKGAKKEGEQEKTKAGSLAGGSISGKGQDSKSNTGDKGAAESPKGAGAKNRRRTVDIKKAKEITRLRKELKDMEGKLREIDKNKKEEYSGQSNELDSKRSELRNKIEKLKEAEDQK
jgi:hypothetical protein